MSPSMYPISVSHQWMWLDQQRGSIMTKSRTPANQISRLLSFGFGGNESRAKVSTDFTRSVHFVIVETATHTHLGGGCVGFSPRWLSECICASHFQSKQHIFLVFWLLFTKIAIF